MDDLSAFILAGGKSARMGADKAFLQLDGQPLIVRLLALARTLTPRVSIVGSRDAFAAYAPVVPDLYLQRGPLAGIHAALTASTTELNLILAVDLPFLDPAFLTYLAAQARDNPQTIVTVPMAGQHLQTLCAVYRRPFLDVAARALENGLNKIDPLFALVPTRILQEPHLKHLGFSPQMFHNLNTPAELEEARRRVSTPPR